jgi:hypothetical protein
MNADGRRCNPRTPLAHEQVCLSRSESATPTDRKLNPTPISLRGRTAGGTWPLGLSSSAFRSDANSAS